MTSSLRIVVTGLLAAYPLGGMAWHYLQYLLGLARLGHEVYYLEDSGRDPYSPAEGGPSRDGSANVDYLAGLMARFGLAGRWAYRAHEQSRWFGLADRDRDEVQGPGHALFPTGTAMPPCSQSMPGSVHRAGWQPVGSKIATWRA